LRLRAGTFSASQATRCRKRPRSQLPLAMTACVP
jgi:hypothetical protein